jgi:lysophospholipase L1-like esterase
MASDEASLRTNIESVIPSRHRWKWYVFVTILLLLVAGEISLRVFAGRDSKFQIRLGAEKEWDPYRRTRWRKNLHSGDFHTNSRGFLGPEFQDQKPPGVYRIVCLGDSASVVPVRYNYPTALHKRLREQLPDKQIEIINASVAGYDSRQARVWYEREVNDIEHDMLLIYLGWNDMGQYNPDGLVYKLEETGYLKEPNIFDKLILNVYLLRSMYVIRGYLERRQQFNADPLTADELKRYEDFYPTHFEQNLKSIIELAKAKNRVIYMLNYGGLVVENPTDEEKAKMHFPRGMGRRLAKYRSLMKSYERALGNVSEQTAVPIIDVKAWFADPEHRRVFTDSAHFKEEGSDMFADVVANVVKQDIR